LSFLGVDKGMTPQKPKPTVINASDLESHGNSTEDTSGTETTSKSPIPPPRMRRLGRPEFTEPKVGLSHGPPLPQSRPKRPKESPYPVFWVEVLDESKQKWIPIDPIVTHTIGKAQKLEPPSKDPENNMSYVVAFEEDGTVRDVTRRYSKYFNAKTRKNRVESTKDGERWWRRTMNFYRKPFQDDRDQIEAGELAAKEAREPMPRNVQDFKDHPLYALERHLKRNEVVHPRREIGKVGAGKISVNKADGGTESIFRRRDVYVVRSAEGWYRLGREVKSGEQPLKRAAPRRNREVMEDEDGMVVEDPSVGLYAEFQTDVYKPPPVVNGKIPRNIYGNLDVYRPSMVPEGGFHLQHPQGVRAATLLGIDYAEAVTGFEFKGRQGHAVFQGIVAALEYQDALIQVLEAFGDEEIQALEEKRTLRALSMWKRLLLRLRIKERVEEHGAGLGGEDEIGEEMEDVEEGGGFFPDADKAMAEPTAREAGEMESFNEEGGGFMADEQDEVADSGPVVGDTEMAGPPPSPVPKQSLKASPRKEKPPRYILHVRSLDEPDLYAAPPDPAPTRELVTTSDPIVQHHYNGMDGNESFPATMSGALPCEAQQLEANEAVTNEMAEHASSPREQASVARNLRVEDSESELEKSSLLSHDPEDEDADPEWVVDF
jgi:xeroderma pigmentosum group C-complementing protein